MSDQHVVTDWRAYFDSLGPGKPTTPEQLEAMRILSGPPRTMLIINDPANFVNGCGGLMETVPVEDGISIEDCKGHWVAEGHTTPRPEMWIARQWPGGPTEYIAPEPVVARNRKK